MITKVFSDFLQFTGIFKMISNRTKNELISNTSLRRLGIHRDKCTFSRIYCKNYTN